MNRSRLVSPSAQLPVTAILVAVLASGCSGSGDGLDENGRPVGEGGDATDTSEFTRIQQTVFTPLCTQCHQGSGAPLGLRLDAGNSYAMLVGVASVEVPGLLRVEPGLPDRSYLVRKVEGSASVGGRMPLGGPSLPQSSIDLIRSWIAGGAQPPAIAASSSFVVQATVPAATELASAPLGKLAVFFSAPVDGALADAGTFALEVLRPQAEPTGGYAWQPVVVSDIAVSVANPGVVILSIDPALRDGLFRLRVRGDGPTALADVYARVLDGDADGAPGGDYIVAFEVKQGVKE